MFRKLLGLLGFATGVTEVTASGHRPYPKSPQANAIYNLLFCDDDEGFRPQPGMAAADWQGILFASDPDPTKVAALADDAEAESRVRLLAYRWLRRHGHPVKKGVVLGVVIEVRLDQGLDVLAAYPDGRVRYINHTGAMKFYEPDGSPDVHLMARKLVELAEPAAAAMGAWEGERNPPPVKPKSRITVLASDGPCFADGSLEDMQEDDLAGPLVAQGTELLLQVVRETKQQ